MYWVGAGLKRLVYMIVTIFHIVESFLFGGPWFFLRFWSFHVNSCVHIFTVLIDCVVGESLRPFFLTIGIRAMVSQGWSEVLVEVSVSYKVSWF